MHGNDGAVNTYVDLHIHTTFSDGECSVPEVLDMAKHKDLAVISISDHDTINAYPHAIEIGAASGIEVIVGTELSSEINGVDVHILGYFVDINNEPLRQKLLELKDVRYTRAKKMVRNLNRQGIDLRFETVLKYAGAGAIGRPHIATAMLNEELVYSFKEAFDKYIGYESPAYVEKLKMTPGEVFSLILNAGGIPVLAHPGVTQVDERIPQFIREGLAGIEVFHSDHSTTIRKFYQDYCNKHNLAFTGGSDFHSQTQTHAEIGVPKVPYSVIERLKAKRAEIHGR